MSQQIQRELLTGIVEMDETYVGGKPRRGGGDGTPNKSRLGANAILAVSLALAKAAAEYEGMPLYQHIAKLHGIKEPTLLPVPFMNVINGGAHANNGLDFQEFMIVPVGARNFSQAMKMGTEVYGHLKKIVRATGVGDEGGFSPTVFKKDTGSERVEETMSLLLEAIKKAGYKPGEEIALAMDTAASQFFNDGKYNLAGHEQFDPKEMVEFYQKLVANYPIVSIEDGMAEKDELGWQLLTQALGRQIQLVGDDLFVTNPTIFRQGIDNGLANAVLIKPNQIGTVSETLQFIKMARDASMKVIVSHRSGETNDYFIADFAVGVGADYVKFGAPARGERVAKYNRLLSIELETANPQK